MKPYYEDAANGIVIYHGDCREVIPHVRADLVVTSPPYLDQRDYLSPAGDPWVQVVPPALARVSASQVLVNLGLVHRDGEVVEYWNDLVRAMRAEMWRLFGWYVWDKTFGLPGEWNGRLAPSHEFVFHFNRERRYPHKIEPCVSFGRDRSGTALRQKNGETRALGTPGRVSSMKIPDSVLRILPEMRRDVAEHPALFPIALPTRLILAYSDDRDTVLDPFMGSGTTLVAAKESGRHAIGIEIEERYCEIAVRRLAQGVLDFTAHGGA